MNFLPTTFNPASSKSAPLQNINRIPAFCLLYPTVGLPSKNQTGWACQILLSASDSDFGTYDPPAEKDYGVADSAFVPVGGETCAVNPPRSECPSALAELTLHHWTYLNIGYNTKVLDSWRDGGCFDQIACRLGYRLALRELKWAAKAAPGGPLPVSLTLVNDGFAAPVNARPLLLVPYPKGASRGDQILNAQSLEKRGLCHVLLQENMTPQTLTDALMQTWAERDKLTAAVKNAPPADGTKRVLEMIEEVQTRKA